MKIHSIFGLTLLIVSCSAMAGIQKSQDSNESPDGFSFVSSGLQFRPLTANVYEPRVGILSQLGKNLLRLDIGNSIDLIQYRPRLDSAVYTIGSDFFTYTLLRGEHGFHFPVDASDYFFGINASYRKQMESGILTSRLRISHISSHFVDGHYDNTTASWKDGRAPTVYSREFLDIVGAWESEGRENLGRFYLGATYLFHVDPKDLPRFSSYAGLELYRPTSCVFNPYFAYQVNLMKVNNLSLRHSVQLGVTLGSVTGRGLDLFAGYFSGFSIHGEYFNVKDSYFALGFLVRF